MAAAVSAALEAYTHANDPLKEDTMPKKTMPKSNSDLAHLVAEAEITRLVLAALLVRLVEMSGPEILDELERAVRTAIGQAPPASSGGGAAKRIYDLRLSHLDDFFRKLRAAPRKGARSLN